MKNLNKISIYSQNPTSIENIGRLESLFFELLDRLRFNWKTNEAIQILIVLFFIKRFFEIKNEPKVNFVFDKDDVDFFSDLEFHYISNPNDSLVKLRILVVNISRNNRELGNIFSPLGFALEKEEDLKIIIEVLIEMNLLSFSISSISISDFGYFFNNILRNLSYKTEQLPCSDFLSRLIVNVIDVKENSMVYLPFSGFSNLIRIFKTESESTRFIAFEKNQIIWSFSKMNLILNGIYEDILFMGNPLTHSDQEKYNANVAVGVFPFGMRLETRIVKNRDYINIPFEVSLSDEVNCESLVIQNMIYQTVDDAKISYLMPLSSLENSGEERKIREYLLKRDWLETIISLPNSLTNNDLPIALMLVNKNKNIESKGFVNFISIQQDIDKQFSEFEIFQLISSIKDKEITSDFINFVKHQNDYLIQEQGNLNPKKYTAKYNIELNKIISGGNAICLFDILFPFSPLVWVDKTESVFMDLPLLTVDDLSTGFSDYQLNIGKIKSFSQCNVSEAKLLKDDAVLFYKDDNQTKINYFEYNDKPLLVQSNVHILKFDKNLFRSEYLILQLYSELFQQQLNNFWTNASFNEIESIFSKIIIERPSFEIQDKYSKDKKLSMLQFEESKVENLRNTLNLDKRDAQSRQNKIISSIHHELGNRIPAVLNEFKNLRDYIIDKSNSEETINLKDSIFPILGNEIESEKDNLSSVLKRLENNLVNAIESLNSTGQIIRAERDKMQLDSINLGLFLKEWIELYPSENNFNIVLEYASNDDLIKNDFVIQADRAQLKTLLLNLIENARKHGFVEGKKYTIYFRLSLTNDNLILIDYKNDGKEFPKDFSFDDFISYGYYAGKTGNSGIGGFLIHQIIENHKGEIYKVENIEKNDPFKVHFRIYFPLKTIL